MKKSIALLLGLLPATVIAHPDPQLSETIRQLEARVQLLEQRLGVAEPQRHTPVVVPQGLAAAPKAPVAAVTPGPVLQPGKVEVSYWLSATNPFVGTTATPLRTGLMPMPATINLDPSAFGHESGGLFNAYLDPSRFPVAAASFSGDLMVPAAGNYRLIVRSTPPREVGGGGNVKVAVDIDISGQRVLAVPSTSRLSPYEQVIQLRQGRQPITLNIVARSPGFGPSPTKTRVFIGLQAADAIAPMPIGAFMVAGEGD